MARSPKEQQERAKVVQESRHKPADPRVELVGRVADKWTMVILELLVRYGVLRFTELSRHIEGISQKMLAQTLRAMERDGLVLRTAYAVVPPKVEYKVTTLGLTLSAAFCGVWVWAEENLGIVERARASFDAREK